MSKASIDVFRWIKVQNARTMGEEQWKTVTTVDDAVVVVVVVAVVVVVVGFLYHSSIRSTCCCCCCCCNTWLMESIFMFFPIGFVD